MDQRKRTPARRKSALGLAVVKTSLVTLSFGLTVGGCAALAGSDPEVLTSLNVAPAPPAAVIERQPDPPPTPTPAQARRRAQPGPTATPPPTVAPPADARPPAPAARPALPTPAPRPLTRSRSSR